MQWGVRNLANKPLYVRLPMVAADDVLLSNEYQAKTVLAAPHIVLNSTLASNISKQG